MSAGRFRPARCLPPVASTSPSAAPEVMYVPAKARSPARSVSGTLSPVSVDASTFTSSAVASVMSAGTRSPGERTTMSPTTTSAASTITGCPSRRTTTPTGSRSRRRSAARSARCSCTNANTPLTMITTRIATPSCGMPAMTASTPAAHSMRAKKWVNWAMQLAPGVCGGRRRKLVRTVARQSGCCVGRCEARPVVIGWCRAGRHGQRSLPA